MDDDTDGDGASVDQAVPHTLENDTGTTNGVNDCGETWLGQDNISGTTSGVGSTLDSDPDIGTGQGGSVIGTIAGHAAKVTRTLETLDNLVLVFGENASETVNIEDRSIKGGMLAAGGGSILQNLSRVHMVTQTKVMSSFLRDGKLITGTIFIYSNTECNGIVDCLFGVIVGRVEDWEETGKFKTIALGIGIITVNFLKSDGQGTETAHGSMLASSLFSMSSVLLWVQSSTMIPVVPLVMCLSWPVPV